jgi:hypothetical protein
MKTRELAAALTAFANLAEGARADELRRFAAAFSSGKEETVASRMKKIPCAKRHPAMLKASLETIRAGFVAAGATKQAMALGAVLSVFQGPNDAAIDAFIAEMMAPPPQKAQPLPPQADHKLANELAEELRRTVVDKGSFNEVVKRLRVAKSVNTPTLTIIANRFLGNNRLYTGRKDAIDDIIKRQKSDAREHARSQALSRLGV